MRYRAPAARLIPAIVIAMITLVAATVGSIAAAPQACACSCKTYSSPQEAVRAFNAIFVGVPTSKKTEGGHVDYNVEVSKVYTGNVGATATVSTAKEDTACGLILRTGEENLIFAREEGPGQFGTTSCGPIAKSSFNREEVLEEVYGEPRTIQQSAPPAESDKSNSTLAYVIGGTAASAVLIAVGIAIVISRRRRA